MPSNLSIKISADGVEGVEKGLKQVSSSLGDVGKSCGQAESSMKNLGASFDKQGVAVGAFTVALGAAAANLAGKFIGSMKEFGAEVLREADSFRKLSEQLGMTIEDVAGFDRAANLAGVSSESLSMAMQGVAKALDPEETSEQRQAIEKLGVSLKDSNGLYVDRKEALLRISEAYAKETDATKKANISTAAFGRASKEMTILLNQGREELEKQVKVYGDASGYSEGYARSLEELNSALAKAEISAKGALVALSDTEMFRSAIKWVSDLSNEWVNFLGDLKTKKAIDESAALNDQMGKLADKVAKLESEKAKGKNTKYLQQEKNALFESLPLFEAAVAQVNGLQKALGAATDDNVIKKLNKEMERALSGMNMIRAQMQEAEKAAADQAKAEEERKKKELEAVEKGKKAEEAAKKAAEDRFASLKKLSDQLIANYGTEEDVLTRVYKEDMAKFQDLQNKKLISLDVYNDAAKKRNEKYEDDIAALRKKEDDKTKAFFDEIERKEKNAQEQMLRIRESCAKTDAERDQIAIDRIKQKYAEELKMAEETKVAKTDIEKAMNAEIEAVNNGAREREKAKKNEMLEYERQLRETSAESEEERLRVQWERMNASYDEQVKKARENSELIIEIERARAAEIKRIERQLSQSRLDTAEQYLTSMMQITKSAAVLGKAGGNAMKGIAVSEAIINTAIAATKAMTAAKPPLNFVLAAAATASGMAQVATIQRQKFAEGGVVGGNSYYGDHVPVQANSGELILNKRQQKELFKIANGEREGGKQVVVNFSPQVASGMNSEDVKKMLRENQNLFRSFLATEVSKGFSSAGAFT